MKVLFISSGNIKKEGNPIIRNQGKSLTDAGVELDYYLVSGKGILGYLKNIEGLRKKVKEFKPDVVHAHYAFNAYLANLAGVRPLVVSLMGSDIWTYKIYPYIVRGFRSFFSWGATIAKSQEMRRRVGIPETIVIPNGVDMEMFRPMNQKECQILLGWSQDAIHVLFPADPSIARKNWPQAEAAVETLRNRYSKPIELHPFINVPNTETPIWYNAADAVVLPSFYEGSANALKECMACAKPIVTTDMGDCAERLVEVTGSAVAKTYEVEEFSKLLAAAIDYEGPTNGRERLLEDGLSSKQVAQVLIDIYSSLCQKS